MRTTQPLSYLIPAPGLSSEDELAFRSMIVCPPAYKAMHMMYIEGAEEDNGSEDSSGSGSDDSDSSVDSSSNSSGDDSDGEDNRQIRAKRPRGQ